MPGRTHHAAGGGQHRSPTAAIGHRLAQMYEGFVRSPLPERLTHLLDEIERAEQEHRRSAVTKYAFREMIWLSCLMWGILLMISAATEGFPYTSIHIRGEFAQDAVGALGVFLAVVGVILGFSFGKKRK